jgi:hypothetical protein
MIECVLTVDYEIYGNGEGSLRRLVYEPAQQLLEIFNTFGNRFVIFVEAAELKKIQEHSTDEAIHEVSQQIQEFYRRGFEIGLHIHPQWCNGRYENGRWMLDYSEYNLCTLPRERIAQIVDWSIAYFREVLGVADFTPFSFRAGNWLFQPTITVATVLAGRGVKVDSSVFKGGLQRQHKLDYRGSLKNRFYWKFTSDINVADPEGDLLELPIHTEMVPFWKMLTFKRIGLQRRTASSDQKVRNHNGKKRLQRIMDFVRFRYPLKLDFCRMTIDELIRIIDAVIKEDQKNPSTLRPIVAIGHTKDLVDFTTVASFLSYLKERDVPLSTFEQIYPKMILGENQA